MKISIVIPTLNRSDLLTDCLKSIKEAIAQAQLQAQFEVIVLINGLDPLTQRLSKKFPGVKFHQLARSTPAAARNMGIQISTGDTIVFLDDDIQIPSNYFLEGFKILQIGAEVFGGPDQISHQASFKEKLVGHSLASLAGTGHTFPRHYRAKWMKGKVVSEASLSLCNLWVKKSVLTNNRIRFDENFFRNEENVLLMELSKKGIPFTYWPDLYVYHRRRIQIAPLMKAFVNSGFYRFKSLELDTILQQILYLVPLAALAMIPIALYTHFLGYIAAGYLSFLFLTNIVASIALKAIPLLYVIPVSLLQVLIHTGYAIGSGLYIIEAILKWIAKKFEDTKPQYI